MSKKFLLIKEMNTAVYFQLAKADLRIFDLLIESWDLSSY